MRLFFQGQDPEKELPGFHSFFLCRRVAPDFSLEGFFYRSASTIICHFLSFSLGMWATENPKLNCSPYYFADAISVVVVVVAAAAAASRYPLLACHLFPILLPGDLERLRRFWLTGTCNPKKVDKKASEPLAPEQFLSAFALLVFGIGLAAGLMGMEHAYIKWVRGRVAKKDRAGCCALISMVR